MTNPSSERTKRSFLAALIAAIVVAATACSHTPEPEETTEVSGRQGVPLSRAYAYADPDIAHYAEAKKLQGACHVAYRDLKRCDDDQVADEADTDEPPITCAKAEQNAYAASDNVVVFLRVHSALGDVAHLVIRDSAGWPDALNGCTGHPFVFGPLPR